MVLWLTRNKPGPKRNKPSMCTKAIVGGFSGIFVSSLVHPLDLVKIRLQVHHNNFSVWEMTSKIIRCEGFTALYYGLSANVMRQATNTTTRLAVSYWLLESYKEKYNDEPNLADKILIGLYAGLAGAMVGNPSELALVRIMADGSRDPCSSSNFKHHRSYNTAFQTFHKIASTEGFCALWRGSSLTMLRAGCISVIQIGSYFRVRDALVNKQFVSKTDRVKLHTYASIVSSFVTATMTQPVDTIKSRYQISLDAISPLEMCIRTLNEEGVIFLWRGFGVYYVRMTVHTIVSYLVLQKIADLYY